jgi:4-amino-4-deoxy-L-arabinose transferase-like glycosyltransferase
MFGFMAGVVNNDMGVNAAAAVVTLLVVRLLRRGWSWRLALGLGAAVAITPLMKATGYAVYPGVALALAIAAWRSRDAWRRWVPGVALVAGTAVAVLLVWGAISGTFERTTFATPGGGAPGAGAAALDDPTGTVAYFWEVFLPRLPGMAEHWTQTWPAFDIYGVRGWGAFGWYALSWPRLVYVVIMVALLALSALGVVAVVRRFGEVRERLPELVVLLTLVGGTLGVMIAAYYSPTPQGGLFPEQGRYVFPAITSLAALFTLATLGVGRRWATPLVTGAATAVVCLGYASLWLVLGGFYFSA